MRLSQGDFARLTTYENDPLTQARAFEDAGATWLHVVDLDGAKAGTPQQFDLITTLARQTRLKMQVGGGVRDAAAIERLLDVGVYRVIVGSMAITDPRVVQDWLASFGPQRIVLALDVRLNAEDVPEVSTHGWQSDSRQSLWQILGSYAASGLQTILCTDIGRDGLLQGANHALYEAIQQRWPDLDVMASGGVNDVEDLVGLAKKNLAGAIVGKALYEGRIDLASALRDVADVG